MKLNQLLEAYMDKLKGAEFSNEDFRSEKLKTKLLTHYEKKIFLQTLRIESDSSDHLWFSVALPIWVKLQYINCSSQL